MTTAIDVVRGDITIQQVDAIVNAANSAMLGGGGVDGAIHAAAGPELLQDCRRVRRDQWPDGLPVGQAAVTAAGRLPCRWVVHTVGPNWNRGQRDPQQLRDCFSNSLLQAHRVGARSIAFPAISAGAFGWNAGVVAAEAANAVQGYLRERPGDYDLVRFVLFDQVTCALFEGVFG